MDTPRWGEGSTGQQPVTPYPDATQGWPTDFPGTPDDVADPENPFEEPEAAPELRQARSESLYSRSTPFWERVVELPPEGGAYPLDEGYWEHPEEMDRDVMMHVEELPPLKRIVRKLTSRGALRLFAVLALLVMLLLLGRSALCTVKVINVEGNSTFTDEEIIALSGLQLGMSTFDLDEDLVMERIGRERYLRCTLVDLSFNVVTLHVRERVPCCSIVQNGRRITLDDRGWVLEITDDVNVVPTGLISVTGLDVHSLSLGQAVTLRVPARLTAYTQILVELRALGGLELIAALDMTTMDSITLTTTDGMTVLLGNETQIHQKIRAFLVVRENLISNNFYGKLPEGTVVVSDPGSPAYRPPET